ncbi:MAG: nucleoside hydrolase [Sphaerochaetaceae bacterium]
MAKKIVLDVDTGHDDMIAILMASGLPEIDLLGIVAVSGNQILEKTLLNTLRVTDLIKEKCPVFGGSNRPIVRDLVVASDIHGVSGLDGPKFGPLKKEAEKTSGVQFIIETVLANPYQVTLVPTGPLTDIALAIRLEPKIVPLIKEIVLMGGSLGKGNRTEYAEFNIYADGEAAHIVYNCGAPIVMMGLDVTLQLLLDNERLEFFRGFKTKTSEMFCASMDHYMQACRLHGAEYPAMHDPCCVAYVVEPSLFSFELYDIKVELKDAEKYGKTTASKGEKVKVATKVNQERFWALLERSFKNLP